MRHAPRDDRSEGRSRRIKWSDFELTMTHPDDRNTTYRLPLAEEHVEHLVLDRLAGRAMPAP
jgi:hypothetical protein